MEPSGAERRETAPPFWAQTPERLFAALASRPGGLTDHEARGRRGTPGKARRGAAGPPTAWPLLIAQFRSPISLLMAGGGLLSIGVGEYLEGGIILLIFGASGLLGFWQEKRAADTLRGLMNLLQAKAEVLRGGKPRVTPADRIVSGDVALLRAGSVVPGDGLLLEAAGLFADESALTGEPFAAAKRVGRADPAAPIRERAGSVFMGTHIVSGTGTVLIAATGEDTVLGGISLALEKPAPATSFETGLRHYGYLLLEAAMALSVLIFACNVWLRRPVLDSFLFTLALAVGLTPQLLPAIQGITMARGAARMAGKRVLVRRLAAIEDIGGMAVLCTDKTGTLTQGAAVPAAAEDPWGKPGERLRLYAYLNAALQAGYANPMDAGIRADPPPGADAFAKRDEAPYDFDRKRLSVAVRGPGGDFLITKGSLSTVLDLCARAESGEGNEAPIGEVRARILERAEALGAEGCRCLGVAYRTLDGEGRVSAADERELIFLGILAFRDPVKPTARESLSELRRLGIRAKMITGDSRAVAAYVARETGLRDDRILLGRDVDRLGMAALAGRAARTDVFAETAPAQKERIILALRRSGLSVGYMGDGINDAMALHAADIGISVDSAADVTKRAADIVLLRKDLRVLADGVAEGRRAFANTLKYVFITSSANLGNMLSMAGASFFTPFLPMLPPQILLLNLLSDLPAMAIAADRLDPEDAAVPRRWNNREIRRFMILFGLISSFFDFLTFGILLALRVPPEEFRTAWFLESLLSELLILMIIRTRRWAFRSRPGAGLWMGSAGVAVFAIALPWLPGASRLGFAPLTPTVLAVVAAILAAYALVSETTKRLFAGGPVDHPAGRAPKRHGRPNPGLPASRIREGKG